MTILDLGLATSTAASVTTAIMDGSRRLLLVYGVHPLNDQPLDRVIERLARAKKVEVDVGIQCDMWVGHLLPTPPESRIVLPAWLTSAMQNESKDGLKITGHFGERRYGLERKLITFNGRFNATAQEGAIRLSVQAIG